MTLWRSFLVGAIVASGTWTSGVRASSPFAAEVVEFAPAPGQFVNDPDYGIATHALGEPSGGGTFQPDNLSVVTLGGFGGFIILRFDHMVEDHPLNPFGMDAIVFGNAYWVDSEAARHWAECATIEIALDANQDGRIDEDERGPGVAVTRRRRSLPCRAWTT